MSDLFFWTRFSLILGMTAVVGTLFLRWHRDEFRAIPMSVQRLLEAVFIGGTFLLAFGSALDLSRLAVWFTGESPFSFRNLQIALSIGLITTPGRATLFRILLAGVLLGFGGLSGRNAKIGQAAAAFAVLLTLGMTSHAMGSEARILAVPLYSFHAAAAGMWGGGLVLLAILGWGTSPSAPWFSRALQRFSRLGLYLMGLLIATGIAGSLFLIDSHSELRETSYGLSLLLKLLLVGTVLSLAAVNRFVAMPASLLPDSLPESEARSRKIRTSGKWNLLRFSLLGEALLGTAVLVCAVLLATTPPPLRGAERVTITLPGEPATLPVMELASGRPVRLILRNESAEDRVWTISNLPHVGGNVVFFARHPEGKPESRNLQVHVPKESSVAVEWIPLRPGRYPVLLREVTGREGSAGELIATGQLVVHPPRQP